MNRNHFTTLMLALMLAFGCQSPQKPRYQDTTLPFEERARALVAAMTLEEKVSQMVYESPAIDRLGIPEYNWWNECLHGVGRAGISTVFPQAIGMAAMWDTAQMHAIATAISDEARAKHHAFMAQDKRGIYQGLTFWTPNINIFRDPRWGRGMETYGEDPYLSGELAVPFIRGLQGDDSTHLKLIATVKHFVVHSGPESSRHSFNTQVNDRDFYETYTPHFRKTIRESGVYSVMCAYNRFRDQPCCGSTFLDSLLRVRWGFNGYIVSDCWAIRDFYDKGAHELVPTPEEAAAMAVGAGTDLNCGDTYPALVKAVKQGLISEAEIDISVTRLMLARMKLGMFDDPATVKWSKIPYQVVDSREHQQLALEAAQKSMVLLRNEHNTLPLSKSIKNIAVIGPNADNTDVLLGNYHGYPSNPVTPYAGIRAKLPSAEVTYAQGCRHADELPTMRIVPEQVFYTNASKQERGLTAQYFANDSLHGQPAHIQTDKTINFAWWDKAPFSDMDASAYSVKWTGVIVPEASGRYAIGGEGFPEFTVTLADSLICQFKDIHHPKMQYTYYQLESGKAYPVTVTFRQRKSEYATVKLMWDQPGQPLIDEAMKAAKDADVVVLCVGLSPLLEGEEMKVSVPGFSGGDRIDIGLPPAQLHLIGELRKLHKPMVMVLLNGSAISLPKEADNIPAIVEAWYPGQAGGTALADILFGDCNPSGRLPVTFYEGVDQLPDINDYSMENRTYRYFKGKPLFAFGHGLSYTTFAYSNLQIPSSITAGDTMTVTVDVTNKGQMDGDEVVQLYLSHPRVARAPIRSLRAFARVTIPTGETRQVTFRLTPEQMAIVNHQNQQELMAGQMKLSVGGGQPSPAALARQMAVEKTIEVAGSFVCRE
ncbi:MAG: glycoside hydrolase family 3 C-terminal domain-containing protein [Marinilabiliaceae bacterium]|nr:glycoside hydrolase family 3 C-terminal domain-containing protein [Marinilabiliaceae bacterium]